MTEFDLIHQFFQGIGDGTHGIELGIGDDCAVVTVPAAMQMCVSVDTVVEGVHFPKAYPARHVAFRALGCALSDLAAMGASPAFFTLALTLPDSDPCWLSEFAKGLQACAHGQNVQLVGGDTTRGALSVTVSVHGYLPAGTAMRRKGACIGDNVVVSGTLGDAAAGLDIILNPDSGIVAPELQMRFDQPQPRLSLGQKIRGLASACIDVSDGLVADAGHIAAASDCKIELDQNCLPLSESLKRFFPEKALAYALTGGDDYELLFTVDDASWNELEGLGLDLPLTRIGRVVTGAGVSVDGKERSGMKGGYLHFD